MLNRTLLAFLLVFLTGFPATAQSDEQPEDPRLLSYQVCDWGLITIEDSTEQPAIYIDITSPADYSAVSSAFTVSGTGAGLFEGNVIIEVSAFGGDTLFTGTTVLQTDTASGAGTWSMDIDLGDVSPATHIVVDAYSTSPDDGSTVAYASLRLNANAESGLRYVELTSPRVGEAVPNFQMHIEGMAGGAFENNIVIEVRNPTTGDLLVSTPVTVQVDMAGGSGPFSADVDFDAAPGTGVEIYAYQPQTTEGDPEVSDYGYAIVNPLAQTYLRILNLRRDDPILGAQDVCAIAEAEFDNQNIAPVTVNDVSVFELIAPTPVVNLSVHAAGSSVCPAPLRTRITNTDNAFDIEIYRDTSQPAACTMDMAPFTQRLSLGTLPNPDYTITINGQPVNHTG